MECGRPAGPVTEDKLMPCTTDKVPSKEVIELRILRQRSLLWKCKAVHKTVSSEMQRTIVICVSLEEKYDLNQAFQWVHDSRVTSHANLLLIMQHGYKAPSNGNCIENRSRSQAPMTRLRCWTPAPKLLCEYFTTSIFLFFFLPSLASSFFLFPSHCHFKSKEGQGRKGKGKTWVETGGSSHHWHWKGHQAGSQNGRIVMVAAPPPHPPSGSMPFRTRKRGSRERNHYRSLALASLEPEHIQENETHKKDFIHTVHNQAVVYDDGL